MIFKLFFTFFKIGAFTFGGGYAMLPMIEEYVLKYNWADKKTLIDFIAVSESTPGPFAVNIATYIGRQLHGISGAAAATLGVVLPSFIVILIVAKFYAKFKTSAVVSGAMLGLRPAVVGLIAAAAVSVGCSAFFPDGIALNTALSRPFISSVIIFIVTAFLSFRKKLHPILLIIISALLGITASL